MRSPSRRRNLNQKVNMKKAFVIENAAKAEELIQGGYRVTECRKSIQVAQALLLAFILGLEPEDEAVLIVDVDFLDREWVEKILAVSSANISVLSA